MTVGILVRLKETIDCLDFMSFELAMLMEENVNYEKTFTTIKLLGAEDMNDSPSLPNSLRILPNSFLFSTETINQRTSSR